MEIEMELDFSSLYTGPTTPVVVRWMKLFMENKLTAADLKDHWRVWVPKAFTPEQNINCLELAIKEETAQEMLIDTLEEFICNGDKSVIFNYLTNADSPPSVCGKVFKMGEPTYNCRECGMDATCVLCVDCFKQSEHKNHRYKMGTSGGGGCCDCGDVEAWKNGPYCLTHIAGRKKPDGSVSVKLPPDLVKRTHFVFSSVLRYAYQILTLEYSPGLPSDLRIKEVSPFSHILEADQCCTVLYNDETHTFDQVISTLARVIKCSQRDAIEFVTIIDREGRTVVKASSFQNCAEVKSEIERFTSKHGTRALKVHVVHAYVIAHQMFALSLLNWLQKMTSLAEGFRSIFSSVILGEDSDEPPIINGILQRDSHLWKSARLHWHRLFIAGMFMEYENKKEFAKHFTKFYGSIMKDFIRDDHDHSFSVASLSIQVFTVPTLAHYLIAHQDVLMVLLSTFISECTRKCNRFGKLEFDRAAPAGPFKRASYILYDLRYLLGAPPDVWTDELRKGFLQGVSLVLNLLVYMQGMDSVTRQVGQHMEYEPEWESAFNLHLKLAPAITLLVKWCSTDKIVLVKAYRITLKKLYEACNFDQTHYGEVRELADHSATCLNYDVASQPVSIHLPLSRFLAGLHLHLEKFGLGYDSSEFQAPFKLTPEQIIEPVLRTQVMIAQVHAGMWRRNGYSLSNQIYFYHNVKCRGEMLDRDIVLLQVGASLIESNEFLIHVLNKYGLLSWASKDYESTVRAQEEDGMKQIINMVEEFLSLIIVVVGERYVPGVGKVTPDDCIKNEIIHQLLIKPLSHSEVNKALPDDINHETGMERVIDEVAVFKKPTQPSGKGVYEIKREYLDKYNVFFYHYTKEELSKSEEEQRKIRKSMKQLECCPPPVLPQLNEPFSMVANLLQCDVMLHVINIVLQRSINLRARSFSEAQLHKVLHLIGYALHEEEQNYSSFFTFTARAEKYGLEGLLEELSSSPRVEAHKDLIKWTLAKYRQVASPAQTKSSDVGFEKPEAPSRMTEAHEKEFRAKLAAERRAAVMAQMTKMQQNFMKDNAALFEEAFDDASSTSSSGPSGSGGTLFNKSSVALGPNQSPKICEEKKFTCILCQESQAITPDGPAMVLSAFIQKSTVLHRCKNSITGEIESGSGLFLSSSMAPAPHTGTCGHVMHSSCWKKYVETIQTKENRRPYRLRAPTSFDIEKNEYLCPLCECLSNTVLPIIPPLQSLPHSKSTGPVEKLSFSNWYEASLIALTHKEKALKRRTANKPERSSEPSCPQEEEMVTDEEMWTPVNRTPTSFNQPTTAAMDGDNEGAMIEESEDDEGASGQAGGTLDIEIDPDIFSGVDELVPLPRTDVFVKLRIYQGNESQCSGAKRPRSEYGLSDDLLDMIYLFAQVAYTKGLDLNPHEDNPAVPMLAWKTCAYTIHSIEWLLRYTDKPLLGDFTCRQQDGLENLIRLSGVLGSAWKQKFMINRHGVKLLTMIIDNASSDPSICDWDSFGLLVPLTATFPSMFYSDPVPVPSGSSLELHSFTLMFLSHIAQIIICSDMRGGIDDSETKEDVVSEETMCLPSIVRAFKDIRAVNTEVVWQKIKEGSKCFLRCCAIFYHFLTGVPAPEELKTVGGDTYENLCRYLGIPTTCHELLSHTYVMTIFNVWASHPDVLKLRNSNENIRDMSPLNQLVGLPDDYSELINTVSLFICPNSDRDDSRNPTMCLICGEMLCSQTYCCQTELNKVLVGACTYHTHVCGAGVGMFLRVRECEILLLATPNKGCFKPPPYIDDYGEADQGLRRGNPLHLCRERYKKLQLLWLSHSIYEEIARAMEASHSLLPTQWQHL